MEHRVCNAAYVMQILCDPIPMTISEEQMRTFLQGIS